MAKDTPLFPRFYELEEFRRSVNRKLWTAVLGLLGVAVLSILLTLVCLLRPMPVVAFDSEGRPLLFSDTITPSLQIDEVRIQFFAERFLQTFVGVDSAAIDRDLTESLNMMTPQLREIVLHEGDEVKRRAKYDGANVRSHFEELQLKIAPFDPEDTNGKVHLIAWGRIVFEPRLGVADAPERLEQYLYSQIVLQRCPVRKNSIHGVLVSFVNTRFFESEEDLKVFQLKRQG